MALSNITFSVPQFLSLMGLAQCIYIMVYMLFRAGHVKYIFVPFLYFSTLSGAFFLYFAKNYIGSINDYYDDWIWALVFLGPVLSSLLMLQVANASQVPKLLDYWVLLLIPSLYFLSRFMVRKDDCTVISYDTCESFTGWLLICGVISGALSLLYFWTRQTKFSALRKSVQTSDRYWLIITMLILNCGILLLALSNITGSVAPQMMPLLHSILGLGLAYISGTSLFRIYPQSLAVKQSQKSSAQRNAQFGNELSAKKRAIFNSNRSAWADNEIVNPSLKPEEQAVIDKIEHLLKFDKVYQEPQYSRKELARELNISESVITKLVNQYYNRSFPQLLNEYRIIEAQGSLRSSDTSIKQIANDVGFTSMATFNRVFRELTGQTPSKYREEAKNGDL
jgi:AraC-like DNA-binding protein